MASRRCSTCAIDWPTGNDHKTCPQCGGDTWWSMNGKPDNVDPNPTQEIPVGVQTSGEGEAHAHRLERYAEMGFNELDSYRLAVATQVEEVPTRRGGKKLYRSPLNWQRVKKALDLGNTHALVVEVFA